MAVQVPRPFDGNAVLVEVLRAAAHASTEAAVLNVLTAGLHAQGCHGVVLRREAGAVLRLGVRAVTPHLLLEVVQQLVGQLVVGATIDAARVEPLREVLESGKARFLEHAGSLLDAVVPDVARPYLQVAQDSLRGSRVVVAPLGAPGSGHGLLVLAGAFDVSDTPAVSALASAVGLALSHARLRRDRETARTGEVLVELLMQGARSDRPLERVLDTVLARLLADQVVVAAGIVEVGGAVEVQRGLDADTCAALREGLRDVRLSDLSALERVRLGDDVWGSVCLAAASTADAPVAASLAATLASALAVVLLARRAADERLREREEFLHAQRLQVVGQLAGTVAHDFNNMLAATLLTSRMARETLPAEHQAAQDLVEIEAACERATRLTRQLLMFSRRQAYQRVPVDVVALVRQLQPMLDRLTGERVQLCVELPDEAWPVSGDVGALEQVLLNLVVNARDAMPQGGQVRIAVANLAGSPPGAPQLLDWVRVTVADEGSGMDDETKAHVFEPFFSTKGERGTGLGLAVVQTVVREAGGWVDIESAPGHGTAMHVWLPRAQTQSAEAQPLVDVSAPTVPARVLVVEDDDVLRRFIARCVERSGFTVHSEGSVEAALQYLDGHPGATDLVLSDVVLPDGSGVTLVTEARRRARGLRVVLMSGYLEDESRAREIEDAGFAFLAKPFTADALVRRLLEVLRAPATPRVTDVRRSS